MGKISLLAALALVGTGCTEPTPTATQGGQSRLAAAAVGGRSQVLSFAAQPLRNDIALPTVAAMYDVPASALTLQKTEHDGLGMTHHRYQQMHNGLPVIGAELSLHENANGDVVAAVATLHSTAASSSAIAISPTDAQAIARTDYSNERNVSTRLEGMVYAADSTGVPRLAHNVWVTGQAVDHPIATQVFVDTQTGDVLAVHPHIQTARNRKTYSANNTETIPGTLKLSEGQTSSGDATIDKLHGSVAKAYDCFKSVFQRDSFDGAGGAIIASGHFGQSYANGFWDGSQLAIGDGDGQLFSNIVGDPDWLAHELTHGLTSSTANLIYEKESGALNESMSDIVAAICDAHVRGSVTAQTWQWSEVAYTPGQSGDAARYMANPTQDGESKDHVSGMQSCTTPSEQNDTCWVHYNSGIPNLMFKLLVTGGQHPRAGQGAVRGDVKVPKLGMERGAAIAYRALTTYMQQSTNFAGARTAYHQAAMDLYPQSPDFAQATDLAWYAVGVGPAVANLSTGVGEPSGGDVTPDPTDPDPTDPSDPTDPAGPTSGQPADYVGGCRAGATDPATAAPWLILGLAALRRRRRNNRPVAGH